MEPYLVHAEADTGSAAEIGSTPTSSNKLQQARIASTFSPIDWVECLRVTGRTIFEDKKTDLGTYNVQIWFPISLQEKFPGLGLG